MIIKDSIQGINKLFLDTAPIIYFIEAHPVYGALVKEVFTSSQSNGIEVYTSVLTLTEVLVKPISMGNEEVSTKFVDFFTQGKNIKIIEISAIIAEKAGLIKGRYASIKTIDAIQLAAAIESGAEIFITNDKRIKKLDIIKVLVLDDYL